MKLEGVKWKILERRSSTMRDRRAWNTSGRPGTIDLCHDQPQVDRCPYPPGKMAEGSKLQDGTIRLTAL